MSTRELTFAQAIREALDEELARDERIVVMGEDMGAWGGVFRTTEGLFQKYGPDRIIDTPLSEEGYVGLAVGAAMTGMHPVPEIMFGDFITLVMDQIVNQASKMRYMTGGQVQVPITVRATMGGGRSSGAQHSQSWHLSSPTALLITWMLRLSASAHWTCPSPSARRWNFPPFQTRKKSLPLSAVCWKEGGVHEQPGLSSGIENWRAWH